MQRSAGVLLHPTCLPSVHGIGDIGPEAHRYLEWLASAGVSWWQVLPLHPPGPGFSPYSAWSTFAGSPWLISPDAMVADGLLTQSQIVPGRDLPDDQLDVGAAVAWKTELISLAWQHHCNAPKEEHSEALSDFCAANREWLDDFALFAALKAAHGGRSWMEWPRSLAFRDAGALEAAREELRREIDEWVFGQFLFYRQWSDLRRSAAGRGIQILGDLPIFVALDSADVWAHPELFLLDSERKPTVVAGVPPDYFSDTGQLWGNPLYDWRRHAEDGFAWWIARTQHALRLADAVRLDHFRGFSAYWEVAANERTAVNGRWVEGPGSALFDALARAVGGLPLVAEDLGAITPDVIALRQQLGLPGMAVLHFGFSPDPRSSFIPYNHERKLVVYTGTHDNNTTVGWYREDANEAEKDLVRRYAADDGSEPHWAMMRLALASVADLAIVPHQDLAGLGSAYRMNTPGIGEGNWGFRLTQAMLDPSFAARFKDLVTTYGRAPSTS